MFEVAQDQAFPWLQQISIFLPNRVGSLDRVIQCLDQGQVRVCGMSILDAHDHAVVRLVVDRPQKAIDVLREDGRTPVIARLLGLVVPNEIGAISRMLGRLLAAELNMHYAYALMTPHPTGAAVAVHVDDPDVAATALRNGGFELISQRDLEQAS